MSSSRLHWPQDRSLFRRRSSGLRLYVVALLALGVLTAGVAWPVLG